MRKILIIRRVEGHSMLPTLTPGQLIFATGICKPKVGRVVVAEYEGIEVVKRVTSITHNEVQLIGDNSNKAHNITVSPQQIQAVRLL